jgi:6-phosphofructo-2-kinase / fructose-2,6-biphosphatase 2
MTEFCVKELDIAHLAVWSSTMRRTIDTAAPLAQKGCVQYVKWKALDEIDVGICDGIL